jgi:REP-associated tyrosine transposase
VETDAAKHRRSIRLSNRDYARPDLYFVTICAHERRCIFGRIEVSSVVPSALGSLVCESWVAIPHHFPQVALHEFVIMPNHIHGLIAITAQPLLGASAVPGHAMSSPPIVGAQHRCALAQGATNKNVTPGSLGAIVRSFKSIVARRAHKELGWNGPIWQRNYFERVLRDGQEFSDASRYVAENPMKWEWDRENPQRKPN